MSIPVFQVDAFTDRPFGGNPAAVCLLNSSAEERWMQAVAMEMNLSETAFLSPGADAFDLRWFTPSVEVDLCGHATLAAAHVLWEDGGLPSTELARFHTRSGLLTARRDGNWIELDFPATPPEPISPPHGLIEALSVKPLYVGKSVFDYLVELESEAAVRSVKPDFARLAEIPCRGVIVTSRADSSFDFVSRFFAPAAGINEDPVTGSTHSCLGPFWGERLGKREMIAFQASARGGVIKVRLGEQRVYLGGQARTVLRGELVE